MPLFERSCLRPDDAMCDHVDDINVAIERVRSLLRDEIETDRGDQASVVYGDVHCYLQVHIRRALMFLDGGRHALDNGYGLITLTCARSLYESAACIHDFCDSICTKLIDNDLSGAAQFVFERTFAMRFEVEQLNDGNFNYTAVNILKLIDKLGKVVPDARRSYELLSETVHPNTFGAYMYFEVSREDGRTRFQKDSNRERLYSLLLGAASLFSLIHTDLLDILHAFLSHRERDLTSRIEDYERRKSQMAKRSSDTP